MSNTGNYGFDYSNILKKLQNGEIYVSLEKIACCKASPKTRKKVFEIPCKPYDEP